MPQFKQKIPFTDEGQIDTAEWLARLRTVRTDVSRKIQPAVEFAEMAGGEQATSTGVSCLQQGLEMANILVDLNLDDDAMAAAILYSTVEYAGISLDDICEQFGQNVGKILAGTIRMETAHLAHGRLSQSAQLSSTIDNLRKMLLAMVDDVRVVLIKLAERLAVLKNIAVFSYEQRKKVASETLAIYTPLANRLGIGHLKWQLEDYAFRYLEPQQYKSLSKSLNERRHEREKFVKEMHQALDNLITELGVTHYTVTGRVKHIYSIYKKMMRKKVPLKEIYDITALRVLVDSIEDCYAVLGAIHNKWNFIPSEFDDYITNPKPNGYRSLHTAIYGPGNKVVEVQIRTFQMHQEAELGVAAHWLYKEGTSKLSGYEAKIAWLRQLMGWQEEMADSDVREREAYEHIFDDRVYVFTPNGDVLDLDAGATPVDFAYTIHSEVGNRCRGAKANGKIIPLTYHLKMGDVVEVLTSKDHKPSRDWLNPHKGYINTPRARAKVHHYFRQQDYQRHLDEGEDIFNRELKKTGAQIKFTDAMLQKMHYTNKQDLFAAIGRGDIGVNTVLNILQGSTIKEKTPEPLMTPKARKSVRSKRGRVHIEGIENVLTNMAGCCHPIPGDLIVGYVTLGQGITIHRQDCTNLQSNAKLNPDRLSEVTWGDASGENFNVDIAILAHKSKNLHAEINNLLNSEDLTVARLTEEIGKNNIANIQLTVQLPDIALLPTLLTHIMQLPDVIEAKRS